MYSRKTKSRLMYSQTCIKRVRVGTIATTYCHIIMMYILHPKSFSPRPIFFSSSFQTIFSKPFSCSAPLSNDHEALPIQHSKTQEADGQVKQSSQRRSQLLLQHSNWDGEESMQDAVLRMLVDKYRPLRGETIRSAEEKLRYL